MSRLKGKGFDYNSNNSTTGSSNRPNIQEIKRSQQETAIAHFKSSELSYNGSDRIIFITNGDNIKTIWKRILKKERLSNQNDIKMLISSALVVTDNKSGYEVEELVTELGSPEKGLKKLKEIINFPSMSCDAGLQDNVLSFQHVVLPLMGLLTRTAITECILEKYVHAIFSVVYTNLVSTTSIFIFFSSFFFFKKKNLF